MSLKVLHIHASAAQGGTELRAFQIASRLSAKFEMASLFHCPAGPIQRRYREAKMTFWSVPFPRVLPALTLIRRYKPDVIHIFGLKTNILWRPVLWLAGYRNLIGHIAGLTNSGRRPSLSRVLLDRLTYRFLRIYLSNSHAVVNDLIRYGFKKDKLLAIHNGIVIPEITVKRNPSEVPIIVSVGMLRPVKGMRYLLEALKTLHTQGHRFQAWIIGDGPERESLEELAESYELRNVVQFWGAVDNTELQTTLMKAHIFALLSLSEGISGAAMEAMAVGLPVVATRVGGMPELVEDGQEGFLVAPEAGHAAADRLAALLSQPGLREQMGEKARAKIINQFDLANTLREYESLYGML